MVLKGTIVNNAMNQYLLNARAGQTMSVQVKSPRGKAWFDVYPRNDRYALDDSAEDVKAWEGKLPQSGDYVISVYSDEGNTRYTLKVTVTALLISPSHAKKQTNRPKETSRRMEQWRIKIESLRSQTGIATFWDKHPKVLEFVMAREYQADGRLTICATRA